MFVGTLDVESIGKLKMIAGKKYIAIQYSADRRGTACVEMALVLPLFLMVVLGIIEFGRGMMVTNLATNAAREACRSATLSGNTNASVTKLVNTFLQQAVGVSSSSVTTTITVVAAAGNPDPAGEVGNASAGDLITLKVQVPFNTVALIPGDYLAGQTLTGICVMQHE